RGLGREEAVFAGGGEGLVVATDGLQLLAVDPRHFGRQQRVAILEVRRTIVRPLAMLAQLLAEGLPARVLLGGGRPWIERGQRQGMIEMVGGDQQKTARGSDGAAQPLLGQLGGGECLVIVAKEKADDLS